MKAQRFPSLDPQQISPTRDALHAYARVLGKWTSACRSRRKHWWHSSLRPSLTGLTTGVIHAGVDFEIELNLRESTLRARTVGGEQLVEALHGQPAIELAERVRDFLLTAGVNNCPEAEIVQTESQASEVFAAYSAEHACMLAQALTAVAAAMAQFRANIREETSPIQLWSHHFDLAMLWLPGELVPGQDCNNEEDADKQMNFGFTFGDEGIPEPYFYVTAYPMPKELATAPLPPGTQWHTEGFTGAVLRYRSLAQSSAPQDYLVDLWRSQLAAGRKYMLTNA